MTTCNPELKQAARALGQALNNTSTLRAYAGASNQLAADTEATGLLDELQRVQADVRTRQSDGDVTQAELERLRQLQNQVRSNHTIIAFMEAEHNVTLSLPEVNQEISQLLGVNFAQLGRVNKC